MLGSGGRLLVLVGGARQGWFEHDVACSCYQLGCMLLLIRRTWQWPVKGLLPLGWYTKQQSCLSAWGFASSGRSVPPFAPVIRNNTCAVQLNEHVPAAIAHKSEKIQGNMLSGSLANPWRLLLGCSCTHAAGPVHPLEECLPMLHYKEMLQSPHAAPRCNCHAGLAVGCVAECVHVCSAQPYDANACVFMYVFLSGGWCARHESAGLSCTQRCTVAQVVRQGPCCLCSTLHACCPPCSWPCSPGL